MPSLVNRSRFRLTLYSSPNLNLHCPELIFSVTLDESGKIVAPLLVVPPPVGLQEFISNFASVAFVDYLICMVPLLFQSLPSPAPQLRQNPDCIIAVPSYYFMSTSVFAYHQRALLDADSRCVLV